MRFVIAAGILAHTLPAASEKENNALSLQAERREKIEALLMEDTQSRVQNDDARTAKKLMVGPSFGVKAALREGLLRNKGELVECDPKAPDADVGILSAVCGEGEYCVERENSALGGVCVSVSVEMDRALEDEYYTYFGWLCNDTIAEYYDLVGCDCEDFHLYNNTGTIQCMGNNGEEYCFDHIPGCNASCAEIDVAFEVFADNSYTSNYCYNFVTPYRQQVCFDNNESDLKKENCSSLSFNGDQCAGCYYNYYAPYETEVTVGNLTYNVTIPGEYCEVFDCTNTNGGHSGNTCSNPYSFAPILTACGDPNITYMPTMAPSESPTMTPTTPLPTSVPSAAPTQAPTPKSGGVLGTFSTKGAMSLFGLSVAIVAYFL